MGLFTKLGEFFEAPNGRLDLKQLAGYQSICSLCYVAIFGVTISHALAWSLMLFGLLWIVGDVSQAINVIKAAAGGFRVPDIYNNAQGDLNSQTTGNAPIVNNGPGGNSTEETPQQTPTTTQN